MEKTVHLKVIHNGTLGSFVIVYQETFTTRNYIKYSKNYNYYNLTMVIFPQWGTNHKFIS